MSRREIGSSQTPRSPLKGAENQGSPASDTRPARAGLHRCAATPLKGAKEPPRCTYPQSAISRQSRLLVTPRARGDRKPEVVQGRGFGQTWGTVPGGLERGTHVGGRWQNGLAVAQGPAALPLTPWHHSATLAEHVAEWPLTCPAGF